MEDLNIGLTPDEEEEDSRPQGVMTPSMPPRQGGLLLDPKMQIFMSQRQRDQMAGDLSIAREASLDIKPDDAARVFRLQARTGLPASLIESNIEAFEEQTARADFNPDKFRRTSPIVAEWAAQSPQHAAVIAPDIPTLDRIESTINGLAFNVLRSGPKVQRFRHDLERSIVVGAMEYPEMALSGLGTAYEQALVRPLDALLSSALPDSLNEARRNSRAPAWIEGLTPQNVLRGGASPIKQIMEMIEIPEERRNYVTDVARGVGQLISQVAVGVMSGGFSSTVSTLGLFGMGASIAEEMQQDAIRRGIEIDPTAQGLATVLGGAATAITERYGLELLLKRMPPKVRDRILRYVSDVFIAGGVEGVQEMTEAMAQNLIAKLLYDPDQSIAGLDTLYEGSVGFGAGSIGRMLVNAITPARLRMRSERIRDQLGELNQAIEDSDLRKRSPEAFESLMKALRERSGLESVFVDAESVKTYFQGEGLDPEVETGKILGDGGRAYREAQATGGKLEIPLEAYATKVVGTEAGLALQGAIALDANSPTANEAAHWEANQAEIIGRLQKTISEQGESEGFKYAYDTFLGQLLNALPRETAEPIARLRAAIEVTLAERMKLDVKTLVDRNPINFKRDVPEILQKIPRKLETDEGMGFDVLLDRLRAGDMPSDRKAFGPSVLDLLREWGVQDEGGELAARDVNLDRRPGQRNIARDDGISLDAARERLVELGYLFDSGTGGVATTSEQDVLDLVDRELGGQPQFSLTGQGGDPRAANVRQTMQALQEFLDQLNVDPTELTNDEIYQIVQSGMPVLSAAQAAGVVLDQRLMHGSQALFPRFDTQFVGSGEGWQAYGWGIYLAQAVHVARKYKIAGATKAYAYENAPARPGAADAPMASRSPAQVAYDDAFASMSRLGLEQALGRLRNTISYWEAALEQAIETSDEQAINRHTSMVEYLQAREQVMVKFQENATETETGHLYEVEVADAVIDTMMDWHLPWAEQSQFVRDTLLANGFKPKDLATLTGEGVYWQVAATLYKKNDLRAAAEVASKWLSSIGIRGNRFPDQFSRPEDAAERTYNFVLFNSEDIEIVSIDGEPVTAFEQSSRTLRTGRETLRRFGLDPDGTYTTREVAAALEARQRAKYGEIPRGDQSPETARKIADWMVAEIEFEMLNPEDSGVGWYSEKFQRALDIMGDEFEELKTDRNARNTMTALIAITSDGQKVVGNFEQARDIYARFRKNGKFTVSRGTARAASIRINVKLLQGLYDDLGVEGAHAYLMQESSVAELNAKRRSMGLKAQSEYQSHITVPQAALVFGAKLGAFYANLMGAHGYLTMDRWWSRTFNRYRGTLLMAPTESSLERFRTLIGKPDLSADETIAATVQYAEALEARGFKTRLAEMVGESEPTGAAPKAKWMTRARELAGEQFDALLEEHNLERAANNIYKKAFQSLNDTPFSATDRTFMLEAVNKAHRTLRRKGYNVTVADIQAILWYYEKKLYGALGARDSASVSYEEAARRVVAGLSRGTADPGTESGGLAQAGIADAEGVLPGEKRFSGDAISAAETYNQDDVGPIWSDQFRHWFGDSVVVDETGEPLVVYHGSQRSITEFSGEGAEAGRGGGPMGNIASFFSDPSFWFTTSGENASGYAEERYTQTWDIVEKETGEVRESLPSRQEARDWLKAEFGEPEKFTVRRSPAPEPNVMPVYLRMENPLVVDAKGANWNDIAWKPDLKDQQTEPYDSTWEKDRYARRRMANMLDDDATVSTQFLADFAQEAGYDGLIVRNVVDRIRSDDAGAMPAADTFVVFDGLQVKSAIGNTGAFDPQDPNVLFQGADQDNNLVARHNLSAHNLRHALRMGGLPVPSISIMPVSSAFGGFGEITLIGNTDLINPRKGAKVFGADVYSPRYPAVDYGITFTVEDKVFKALPAAVGMLTRNQRDEMFSSTDVKRRGPSEFAQQPLVMLQFLLEKGATPDIVYLSRRGDEAVIEKAREVGLGPLLEAMIDVESVMDMPDEFGRWTMSKDPDFIAAVAEMQFRDWHLHKRIVRERVTPKQEIDVRAAILKQLQGDGMQGQNMLLRAWDQLYNAMQPPRIDAWETRQALGRQIVSRNLDPEFTTWADQQWDDLGVRERIKTWSEEGNVRHQPHTLRNVVNAMKRNIRAGEDPAGNMYGLGPLRAHFTPQFTSITAIQNAKGRIINEGLFEDVKIQMDDDLGKLASHLQPYYTRGEVIDETLQLMADIPRMGAQRAWERNGFKGEFPADTELASEIREFMERLKNMPTEYFEALVPRAVQLEEFSAAVLPTDAAPDVVEALREAGLRILTYRPNDNLARQQAVIQASEQGDPDRQILFQDADPPVPFYSHLMKSVELAPQDKATGPQWIGMLRNAGVKSEELAWYDLAQWMGDRTVTRQEIQEYLQASQLEVVELPVMGESILGSPNLGEDMDPDGKNRLWDQLLARGLDLDENIEDGEISYALRLAENEAGRALRQSMLERLVLEESETLGNGNSVWQVTFDRRDGGDLEEASSFIAKDRAEAEQKMDAWFRGIVDEGVLAWHPEQQEDLYWMLDREVIDMYEELHEGGVGRYGPMQVTDDWAGDPNNVPFESLTLPGGDNYRILRFALKTGGQWGARHPGEKTTGQFVQSHMNDNLVFWMRVKDRTNAAGQKVFFIEEVQSDWHQKGRQLGYKSEGQRRGSGIDAIPDAPFKTTWQALALKRAVRFAAENGYDAVAWTTGDEQVRRNNLATYVKTVNFSREQGNTWNVVGLPLDPNADPLRKDGIPDAELEQWVGADVAARMRTELPDQPRYARSRGTIELGARDLDMGGQMHRQVYDRNLPRSAGKMFGKYGSKPRLVKMVDAPRLTRTGDAFTTLEMNGIDMVNFSNWIDLLADELDGFPEVDVLLVQGYLADVATNLADYVRGHKTFDEWSEADQIWKIRDHAFVHVLALRRVAVQKIADVPHGYAADPELVYAVDAEVAALNFVSDFVADAQIHMVLAPAQRETLQMWEMPVTPKMAEAAMAGQALFQGGRRGPRGRIEMRGRDEQGVRAFQVVLNRDSNLSTTLHELGHYYFEIMADLAEMDDAPDQIRQDYMTMLRFLGVDHRSQVTREHHEKMARSFEAYLMEGKSPSLEVAGLFGRMRAWLIEVYRHIERLNAPLNDEIRGVFDRMVASDRAIEAAREMQALDPMFKDAAEAGMSESEFQAYQAASAQAREAAVTAVQRELMEVRRRESMAWWKRLRARVAAEVEREVNEQRVYQALAYLQFGKNADGSALPEGEAAVKLDRQALVDMYGKDFIKRLPRPYIYARKDGVDPGLVAEMFGYDSADQMIQEILAARPRRQLIQAETEVRLREMYPDPLIDGSLPVAATDAVMSSRQGQILLKELNSLERRGQRGGQPTPLSSIRAAVERILAAKPVRALDPRRYQSFSAQAGRRAQEAMLTGDFETARVEKQRQLLNHELYRESVKLQGEVEKIRKHFTRLQKTAARARLGKAGGEYLTQIDAITQRYELARVGNRKLDRRRSLREFVEALEADGQDVGIEESVLDEARQVNYREVPIEELRGAYDAVRQLEHFARLKLKFKTRREQANWKDVKRQLIGAARQLPQHRRPLDPNTVGWFKRAMSGIRDLDAAMLKMEQIVLWLDGERVDGPWHKFFFQEFADAQTAKLDLMRDRFTALRTSIDRLTKETKMRLLDQVHIQSLGESVTRDFLIGFALNMGNAGNKKKAIEGMNFTETQVKEMLDHLTRQEWELVQGIWDTFESLWPDIAALQKEMTGLAPPKVEATPVITRFGTFRGGYFPVVYDSDKSKAGMAQENERLRSSGPFATGYSFATTARGHVKARVENFTAAMRFSLDVVPNRLARHIHDLTHRQAVVNAHRILSDSEIKAALQDALGLEVERAMYPWLKRQANDSAFDVLDGTSGFKRVMERLRLNTSVVVMGLKFTTMMSQFGGYFDAAEMVGPKFMGIGMAEFYRNPAAAIRFATSKSGEIKYRYELKDLTLREQLQRIKGKTDWRSKATRFYFMNILVADKMVATAAWIGEYRKQIDAGVSEDSAVQAADSVVRLTQGASGTKDLSAIQATENQLLRWMGLFYTYFNAKYNRIRSMGRRGKRVAKGELDQFPLLLAQVWWGTFLPAVLSEVMAGRGPGDEDDNWALWAMQVWIEFPFLTVIGLRDIASPAIENVLGWRNRPWPGRYQLTPVQQAGESVLRFVSTAAEGLQGEADLEDVMLRGFEAFGYMYGFPTSQAKITGRAILEMLDEGPPDTTRETMRNLIFTPRDDL